MSACNSSQLKNLENQLQICSKGLPLQPYDGYWSWARDVTGRMKRDTSCDWNKAPAYFQSELRSIGYIGKKDIDRAVTCITKSIKFGICC